MYCPTLIDVVPVEMKIALLSKTRRSESVSYFAVDETFVGFLHL